MSRRTGAATQHTGRASPPGAVLAFGAGFPHGRPGSRDGVQPFASPATGETIKIAAGKAAKFSAGKTLKDAVNG